jgi:hypothetical protein
MEIIDGAVGGWPKIHYSKRERAASFPAAPHESPIAGEASGIALAMYTLTSLTCKAISLPLFDTGTKCII